MTRATETAGLPSVVFGLSHVIVQVSNLSSARSFYADCLGFEVLDERSESMDLEGGMTTVRLCEMRDPAPVVLRLRAVSIAAVLDRVTTHARSVTGPTRTPELELVAQVQDADRNELVFWRPLTEDEYDAPVALPNSLSWTPQAEELMQSLLAQVPALFREMARKGAVAEAEHLTPAGCSVEAESVVRAYIRATPRLLRSRVREPLEALGFDLDSYQSDFEI